MSLSLPLCLAIDTSGPSCTVALFDSGSDRTFVISDDMTRGHAEIIMGQIDRLFADCSSQLGHPLSYEQLSRVAVVTGPGSFTGLRVGISVARGIALGIALGLAQGSAQRSAQGSAQGVALGRADRSHGCLGVDALTLFALDVLNTPSLSEEEWRNDSPIIIASVPGRGGQIFHQSFIVDKAMHQDGGLPLRDGGLPLKAITAIKNEETMMLTQRIKESAASTILCGRGLADLSTLLADGSAAVKIIESQKINGALLARLGYTLSPEDYPPVPVYSRAADAIKAKTVFPLAPLPQ